MAQAVCGGWTKWIMGQDFSEYFGFSVVSLIAPLSLLGYKDVT